MRNGESRIPQFTTLSKIPCFGDWFGLILQLDNCEYAHEGIFPSLISDCTAWEPSVCYHGLKEGWLFHELITTDLNSSCKLGN